MSREGLSYTQFTWDLNFTVPENKSTLLLCFTFELFSGSSIFCVSGFKQLTSSHSTSYTRSHYLAKPHKHRHLQSGQNKGYPGPGLFLPCYPGASSWKLHTRQQMGTPHSCPKRVKCMGRGGCMCACMHVEARGESQLLLLRAVHHIFWAQISHRLVLTDSTRLADNSLRARITSKYQTYLAPPPLSFILFFFFKVGSGVSTSDTHAYKANILLTELSPISVTSLLNPKIQVRNFCAQVATWQRCKY